MEQGGKSGKKQSVVMKECLFASICRTITKDIHFSTIIAAINIVTSVPVVILKKLSWAVIHK